MPYAIYSKRTKVINRIVNDLTSLLPSESMIEIDSAVNYPRGYKAIVEGQKGNTAGFPLFLDGVSPSISPQRIDYDGDDRPYVTPNIPIYETPTSPSGRLTVWKDIPITSHPFVWTAAELANLKYESILAKNYPMQVIVGEEFIDDSHIDTGESDNIVLSEGKCYIAPGGELVTTEFQFFVDTRGVIDPLGVEDNDNRQYVFDTYYLDLEPDPPQGVKVYWDVRDWSSPGALGGVWTPAIVNSQTPIRLDGSVDDIVSMGIVLRIYNLTGSVFGLENYILMLRIRNLPYQPA